MEHNLYSIRDEKALAFGPVFQARNHALMARIVAQSCPPDSPMGLYPNEFSVWHIATYDDENADVRTVQPVNLGNVETYLPKRD